MDINTLITHYGYAALVIGSMAEGETVTLLGASLRIRDCSSFRWWRRPSRWEG